MKRLKRSRATPKDRRTSLAVTTANNNGRFRKGDRALIFRMGPCCPALEGSATILATLSGLPEMYVVRFDGEQLPCIRPVHRGDWQRTPKLHLRRLVASWRFAAAPELFAIHSFDGDER